LESLDGNLKPSSSAEIDEALLIGERRALQDFCTKFFAVSDIPENVERFPLEQIVGRALAAVGNTEH
jgi:hypothetical protein